MIILQMIYSFFNTHLTWDFGAELNAKLSAIWGCIGSMLF